jgi:hypothetical protein
LSFVGKYLIAPVHEFLGIFNLESSAICIVLSFAERASKALKLLFCATDKFRMGKEVLGAVLIIARKASTNESPWTIKNVNWPIFPMPITSPSVTIP